MIHGGIGIPRLGQPAFPTSLPASPDRIGPPPFASAQNLNGVNVPPPPGITGVSGPQSIVGQQPIQIDTPHGSMNDGAEESSEVNVGCHQSQHHRVKSGKLVQGKSPGSSTGSPPSRLVDRPGIQRVSFGDYDGHQGVRAPRMASPSAEPGDPICETFVYFEALF